MLQCMEPRDGRFRMTVWAVRSVIGFRLRATRTTAVLVLRRLRTRLVSWARLFRLIFVAGLLTTSRLVLAIRVWVTTIWCRRFLDRLLRWLPLCVLSFISPRVSETDECRLCDSGCYCRPGPVRVSWIVLLMSMGIVPVVTRRRGIQVICRYRWNLEAGALKSYVCFLLVPTRFNRSWTSAAPLALPVFTRVMNLLVATLTEMLCRIGRLKPIFNLEAWTISMSRLG